MSLVCWWDVWEQSKHLIPFSWEKNQNLLGALQSSQVQIRTHTWQFPLTDSRRQDYLKYTCLLIVFCIVCLFVSGFVFVFVLVLWISACWLHNAWWRMRFGILLVGFIQNLKLTIRCTKFSQKVASRHKVGIWVTTIWFWYKLASWSQNNKIITLLDGIWVITILWCKWNILKGVPVMKWRAVLVWAIKCQEFEHAEQSVTPPLPSCRGFYIMWSPFVVLQVFQRLISGDVLVLVTKCHELVDSKLGRVLMCKRFRL